MKRAIGSLLTLAVAGFALSQSAFTIVRPADGSKVRETVRLLFPMKSVPAGSYVGIYLGGKFVEATVPAPGANYLYYDIDTKARQIADGPLQIEAVLFQDFEDRPRIVDRSSINVIISNSANIPIPDDGLALKYRFKPGTEWIYRLTQRVAVNNMSEAMAGNASKASLLAGSEEEHVRLLYAVENSYPGGDGLLRVQAIPEKGKHDIIVTSFNADEPKTFKDYEIHSVYMRLKTNGEEVFGSIPRYFPMEGSGGESYRTDLLAVYPLPRLPADKARPGIGWQTGFQLGDLDLDAIDDAKSLVARLVARGELVGVEWQNGHPCARIKHSLSTRDPKAGGTGKSRLVGAQAIDEDIWFAMDLGTVIKMVRTYTIDTKIEAAAPTNTGAGGVAGGPTGAGRPGGPPALGGAAGGGGGGSAGRADWAQGNRGRGGRGGGAAGDGPGSAGGQGGGPSFGGANAPGQGGLGGGTRSGGGTTTRIVRITVEQVFELEK